MDDVDFIPKIKEALRLQNAIALEMKKAKLKAAFYNNGWRVIFQKYELSQLLSIPTSCIKVEANSQKNYNKTHKTYDIVIDHPTYMVDKGESKGEWHDTQALTIKLGDLCFDKQNDEIRRTETKEYDLLGYSAFDRETLDIRYSVYWIGRANVAKLTSLIEKYQAQKVKEIEAAQASGKRLQRDDIQIPLFEALNAVEDGDVICTLLGEVVPRSLLLRLAAEKIKFTNLPDRLRLELHPEILPELPQMEAPHLDSSQSTESNTDILISYA